MSEICRNGPSAAMAKTFWRMRLYKTLREPRLLNAVELDGESMRFTSMCWDDYWTDIPKMFRSDVDWLRDIWGTYIDSGFRLSHAAPYCKAYFEIIRGVVKQSKSFALLDRKFLSKVLGFENCVLKFRQAPEPFAAATASFRNPIFLSSSCKGIRKNNRNDPSLLPLIVGNHECTPMLYYHYRKQSILKNTDESVLVFSVVDPALRPQSFQGLQTLTGSLMAEWDSRIEQRSRLLADKVLAPLLREAGKLNKESRVLRILDIGSGAGLFTSKVIGKIVNLGVLNGRKMELSLLDILSVDPKRHFRTPMLLQGLSKVEYINSDYITWLEQTKEDGFGKFDIVFLFRILHNMSEFRIGTMHSKEGEDNRVIGRYRLFPHLSDYYQTISLLFPNMADRIPENAEQSNIFHPKRVFNPLSLVTPDGHSIIKRLMEISDGVLIEDADLCPDMLVEHLSRHDGSDITVYDLSRSLRLSVNHIYWIMTRQNGLVPQCEMIWPK